MKSKSEQGGVGEAAEEGGGSHGGADGHSSTGIPVRITENASWGGGSGGTSAG